MTAATPDREFIRHVVLFSARDRADVPRIVEGLSALADIPGASVFEVIENRRIDQFSGETDVIVYAEFPDRAAFDAYKAHPIYARAIEVVRPLRDMRIAADF